MTDPMGTAPAAVPITADPPELPGPTMLGQGWHDVTFLHWRVDAARVAPMLPAATVPDVFDGSTWVGLIPFRLVGAHFGTGPALPYVGTFPETNVRFYSKDGWGRHGVVFGSLDAARLPFVLGARVALGLNYAWSRMRVERSGSVIHYTSRRRWPAPRGARTDVVVQIAAEPVIDDPIADFLTARWRLHSRHLGRTFSLPNTHARWPLQGARLISLHDELLAASGFGDLAERAPDSVLYSAGVRTRFGMPQPVPGAPSVATMPG